MCALFPLGAVIAARCSRELVRGVDTGRPPLRMNDYGCRRTDKVEKCPAYGQEMKNWLILIIAASGFGLVVAFCAGVIRPPRPMFHESYAPGGLGWIPTWGRNGPLRDNRGQWLWVDSGDNLLVVHATGTAERGRSHPIIGGTQAARIRLGSAWADEPELRYVRITRTRDRLVVILPDGRSRAFPIGPGQASAFFKHETQRESPSFDLVEAVGSVLDRESRAPLVEFLSGYAAPDPVDAKDY